MGFFDDVQVPGNSGSQNPSGSSGGGFLKNVVLPSGNQKSQPTLPATPPPTPTPVKSPYFSAVDAKGNSIGFSDQTDVSGKPFLAYRNPGDTSTTTDKTRVATTFDPRVPQKLDPTTFDNYRMSQASSTSIKSQMGGSYSDELDHRISLELSGSNDQSNLGLEPLVPGTKNTATDPLENKLAKQVANGQISLFDAQTQLAKAKGMPTLWTGQPQKPGFLSSVLLGLKSAGNAVASTASDVGSDIKNYLFGTQNQTKGTTVKAPEAQPISQKGFLNDVLVPHPDQPQTNIKLSALPNNPFPAPSSAGDLGKTLFNSYKPVTSESTPQQSNHSVADDVKAFGDLGKAILSIPASIVNSEINPDSGELDLEKQMNAPTGSGISDAIWQHGAGQALSAVTRFFYPLLHPASDDINTIIEANDPKTYNLSPDQVMQLPGFQKSNAQIVGDVAQVVLSAYSPTVFGSTAAKTAEYGFTDALKGGVLSGSQVGFMFGGAQALSSGSKNPGEIAQIILLNTLGGAFLGGITSGLIPGSRAALDKLTKDVITEYKLPQQVYIDGAKIKDIFQTGTKLSPEETQFVKQLGLDANGYKNAIKNGLSIEVPTEKITTIADKPFWAKIKEAVGIKPFSDRVVEVTGKVKQAPAALLEAPKTEAPKETFTRTETVADVQKEIELKISNQDKQLEAMKADPDLKDQADAQAKVVYSDPEKKIYQPKEADRIVNDIAADLDAYKKGLGNDLRESIDTTKTTPDEIKTTATKLLNSSRELNPAYSRKNIFSKISGPKMSVEDAKAAIFKEIPEKDVRLAFENDLIDGIATGQYKSVRDGLRGPLKPLIKLYEEGGKVGARDVYEEVGHYLFDTLNDSQKQTAFMFARKEMGLLDRTKLKAVGYKDADLLEEYIVKKWAKEEATKAGYKGPFQKIFETFSNTVKKIIDTYNKIKSKLNDVFPKEGRKGGYIKNPLAKSEDEVKANLNSPIDERVADLETQRAALEDAINNDPIKNLAKYVNPRTGELPEALGTGRSKFGKVGDELANELGYKDSEEARIAWGNYQLKKTRLANLKEDIKTIKTLQTKSRLEDKDAKSLNWFLSRAAKRTETEIQEAQAAARLQEKVARGIGTKEGATTLLSHGANPARLATDQGDHLAYDENLTERNGNVKPPSVRGGITPPELDLTSWKDKPAIFLSRDTMERNLEKVAGPDADKINKFLVENIRNNESSRVKFVNAERLEIRQKMKDLGIGRRTKESAFVQLYGEKQIGEDQLTAEIKSPERRKSIREAATFFRKKYDQYLDMINLEREAFGYTPIVKRQDYFRHFTELNAFTEQFGILFRGSELPTGISGITDAFNPGKPFTTTELRRIGGDSRYDAIGGVDNYLNAASRQMFHIDSVQRGRALEKYIREAADATVGSPDSKVRLPNFVANLNEYTNLVSGKAARLDRALESVMGRSVVNFINSITKRFGANVIAGNISSAITHSIPMTFNLATIDKVAATRGMFDTLTSPFHPSDFSKVDGVESKFLTRRYPVRYISPTVLEKATRAGGALFEAVDRGISRLAVSSKYYEGLREGLSKEDAMKAADNYATRVIGDRSVGNLPNIMNTRTLRFLTQFQIEVNDNLSVLMHDVPRWAQGNKWKIASSLLQFLVIIHLYNWAMDKVKGSGKGIDPIGLGLELSGFDDGTVPFIPVRMNDGTTFKDHLKTFASDIANELPFSSLLTGQYSIGQGIPSVYSIATGQSTLTKEGEKLLYGFLSPIGGGLQAKKTIEGIQAYLQGVVKRGTAIQSIEQNPVNFTKAILFGKTALPQSQASQNLDAAKRQQSATNAQNKADATSEYNRIKNSSDPAGEWDKLNASNPTLAKKVADLANQAKLNLSADDKKLKSLQVKNGARAKAIVDKLKTLNTQAQKAAYYQHLIDTKIISTEVNSQVLSLLGQQ